MVEYIGPSLPSVVKYLVKARSDPANTLLEISERYGEVAHLRIGNRHVFLVSGPDGVKHILQENQHNYGGFKYSYQRLEPLLGSGLLTSDGEVWRRHRRLAQQAFFPNQIIKLSGTMVETIQEFLTRWDNHARQAEFIDIGAELTRLTLSVVTTSLFGANIGAKAETVKNSVPKVLHDFAERIFNPFAVPNWLPTPRNRDYQQALESLNLVVQELILQGRHFNLDDSTLLGKLIAARYHEGDVRLDDQELRDEVMTIFLAGHETCANALTWTFYLLGLYPEVQECLAEEVHHVLNSRSPTYEDIHRLPYTGMVFNEVLRLYPPAWIMARDVLDQDVIAGYSIPAGSLVFLSPYINHRLNTLWEQPERFDPLRFSLDRFKKLPRFAYFPFGGGQRLCLGKNFALTESLLAISLLIQRYKFTLQKVGVDGQSLPERIRPDYDMHPKTPIFLRLEKRQPICQ